MIADKDVDELRAAVSGPVYTRGDEELAAEVGGFNLAVRHDPEIAVGVASEDDVVEAVRFATRLGLPVRVQATGHGAFNPVGSGMLICTKRLDALTVDPATRLATVGAGVRWTPVIEAAAPFGLAPIVGSTPDVSAVGYTLGGGIGPLVRSHGVTADWVRSFRVVTGRGEVVSATDSEHPELFWALRGGKVGLGVVTEMTVELAELPYLYGGGLFFDGSADIAAALHAWVDWDAALPHDATTSLALMSMPDLPELPPPLRGRRLLHVRFAYPGDEEEGARLLQPMRDAATPYLDLVAHIPYSQVASIHQDPTDPAPAWIHGVMLTGADHDLADLLLKLLGPDSDSPFLLAELRGVGGRLRSDAEGGTAVGGREASGILSLIAVGPIAFQPDVVQGLADAVFEQVRPWRAPVTNINFAGDPYLPTIVAEAWHPDVRSRLSDVRAAYDPAGVLA